MLSLLMIPQPIPIHKLNTHYLTVTPDFVVYNLGAIFIAINLSKLALITTGKHTLGIAVYMHKECESDLSERCSDKICIQTAVSSNWQ